MATIAALIPVQAGAVAAAVATTPAGDEVTYTGGNLLIEFENGHSESITVSIAPTTPTGLIQGAGVAPVPTRSLVLAAGAKGAFLFKTTDVAAYKNAANRIPLTYTTGNVALLIRAFAIK